MKRRQNDNSYRRNWIRKLLNEGVTPLIVPIVKISDDLPEAEQDDLLNEIEKTAIGHFRKHGKAEKNFADGGDGFTRAFAKKCLEKLGSEGRKVRAIKASATLGKDGHSARAKKAAATRNEDLAKRKSRMKNASDAAYAKLNRGLPRGIIFNKQRKKYQARVFHNSRSKHVGFFDTSLEAHTALKSFLDSAIYKEWLLAVEKKPKEKLQKPFRFIAINPNGVEKEYESLPNFCKENNCKKRNVYHLIKKYRGKEIPSGRFASCIFDLVDPT